MVLVSSSNECLNENGQSISTATSYAASFAHQSLKRSRFLFDTCNAKDVLIPNLDFSSWNNSSSTSSSNHDETSDRNNNSNSMNSSMNRSISSSISSIRMMSGDEIRAASIQRRRRVRCVGLLSGMSVTANSSMKSTNNPTEKAGQMVVSVPTSSPSVGSSTDTLAMPPPQSKPGSVSSARIASSDSTPKQGILVTSSSMESSSATAVPTPTWHAPWKLSTVLSSHLGWVRCIAMDPHNALFATGSADRTIKIWNLPKASVGADDALQLTLTGHISPVRGLVFSDRHPYLFSCAEDKTVKCWDLETNQVVRHYHGHLSGVYAISLHPKLDVLVTAGRDAVARVWDIRTKHQIHCLTGHDHTVSSVLTKSTNPQVITSSHDCTIKMWDLAAGKCITTLTHHSKAIRALAMPSFQNTFVSGATDCLKKWQGRDGKFLHSIRQPNIEPQQNVIVHTVAVNDDGVLLSGCDDGSIQFYDYQTGYNFQTIHSKVQPGSLQQAENAVLTTSFDKTGTRLITGEADKTIKIYKEDETASQITHPIAIKAWRKQYISSCKERY